MLEMFSGANATCNVCLAHRKKWADNNPEKVRELSQKYGEEHKEEQKVYNQEYNQREVECEVCRCKVRKCNWLRHWRLGSIGMGLKMEVVGEIWMLMLRGQGGEVELYPKATPYCIYIYMCVCVNILKKRFGWMVGHSMLFSSEELQSHGPQLKWHPLMYKFCLDLGRDDGLRSKHGTTHICKRF